MLSFVCHCLFPLEQQPNSVPGRLIVEVSRSHTIRHKCAIRLHWTSNQLVAMHTAQHQTHETNIHKLNGNRTRDPGTQAAAGLHFRSYGHRSRQHSIYFPSFIGGIYFPLFIGGFSPYGCGKQPESLGMSQTDLLKSKFPIFVLFLSSHFLHV
jgi:hypothetical protein